MLKAYKFRIYPKAVQRQQFAHHFGCVRWVYNWALERTKQYYEQHKKQLTRKQLQELLVALKRTDSYNWLQQVNSQALLASLLHLHKTYQAFFRQRARFPKFKKKHHKQSYQCPQHVQLDKHNSLLHLPKIKDIKIKLHRTFEGRIKTVTISKTPSGKYFASLLIESTCQPPKPLAFDPAKTLGIDLGLTHFAITSQGQKIANPKYLRASLKKLVIAQKERSRKQKQSYNYRKKCIQVAKIHEKVANRRYDFIQQYTASLMRENQATSFAVEDLHIKGLIKNKKLSRTIADSSWGTFLKCLQYKAQWHGKNVCVINRFVASSKTCHTCGKKQDKLPLSVRSWSCACGMLHDRDINAAKVIRNQAIADTLGQSGCVKSSSIAIPFSEGAIARE